MSLKTSAAPCALLLALGVTALAAPALARTADTPAPTTLDSVIVTGTRDPEDPPVVADARDRLSRTPGSVAVVSAESYANRFAQGFADTLRNVPGVLAQKRYGEESRLSIRGSGIAQGFHQRGVLFAQDGVPFADADGFSDFQGIDALSARYIEIYKGSNTLRFGGAQLGGAINLVTPTGRTATQENVWQVETGSYGTGRIHAELARASGEWDVFAAVTGMVSDGYREQSAQSQGRLTLNIGRRFGEDREIRLITQAADIQQEVPGALSLQDALDTPRKAPASNIANDNARDQTLHRVTLQTRWRLDDRTLFEGAVWGWQKSLFHPIFQVIDQDSRTGGAFGRIDWTGQVGGLKADAFYGLSYREGSVDARRFVNVGGLPGALTADGVQRASAVDVFGEGRLFVTDRLALVAGGSWGKATRDYRDLRAPANDDSIDYDWFSPRLGLLWQDGTGTQMFANLTRSVEPPTYGALVQAPLTGFTPVKVQDAWTGEIGARGRRGTLAWDVTVYRSEIDGEILNFVVGPDIPAATFNAGRTIHQGVEAGLDWRLPIRPADGKLTLRQTWAWSDFRFDGDPLWGDNRLPVVPEHQYRAELKYAHPGGWFIAPSVDWRMSDVFIDYANTSRAPAYALLGLSAGWTITPAVSVYLDARNLTDERHVGEFSAVTDTRTASTAVFYPGEGRSAFVGLRLAY
tara:strand:+ start:145 stop:2217 length:2073 start_codon:yes stop_codon:yes gene_type:complete